LLGAVRSIGSEPPYRVTVVGVVHTTHKLSYSQSAWSGTYQDLDDLGRLVHQLVSELDDCGRPITVTVTTTNERQRRTADSAADALGGLAPGDIKSVEWGGRFELLSLCLERQGRFMSLFGAPDAVSLSVQHESEGWTIAARERLVGELRRHLPIWHRLRGLPSVLVAYVLGIAAGFLVWDVLSELQPVSRWTYGFLVSLTVLSLVSRLTHWAFPSLDLVRDSSQSRAAQRVVSAALAALTIIGVVLSIAGLVS
jgi:succinate dehydrogenase hydrophobic anchor subunit